MKRCHTLMPLLLLALALLTSQDVRSQEEPSFVATPSGLRPVVKPFSHLDLSLTTGTTGVGFDLAMPLSSSFAVRAGYATMPHFERTMHFGVDVGDDPAQSQSKFEKLSGLLEQFTGNKVDNVVDMVGKPTFWNWKLLVDFMPLRNKNWHLTAGVFYGNSRVAEAVNAIEDMPSLMAVSIYNNLYSRAVSGEPLVTIGGSSIYNDEIQQRFVNYGRMSIHLGDYKNDVYYEEDVVADHDMEVDGELFFEGDVIHPAGSVMIHKGDAYRIVPDENSMVRAYAYANRWKPYVGFGYGGRLLRGDDRWRVSFDAGALFWGGVPSVKTHDGTDLINDVENVRGHVGDYVDIIKQFKVYPVLNFRLSWRLF